MKKMISAGVVATTGLLAFADPIISYEEDGKALVVTVVEGTENLSPDMAAILNDNVVTNFYKRGEGTLTIDLDTTGYIGHFRIEDGILRSFPQEAVNNLNPTLGAQGLESEGCGSVHVEPGATLAMCTKKWKGLRTRKTTYFGGTGFQGKGALTVMRGETDGTNESDLFGRLMILTADALVYNDTDYPIGFCRLFGNMDMNGHTLTFGGWRSGINIACANLHNSGEVDGSALSARLGDVIVASQWIGCVQYLDWFGDGPAHSNHTMTVKNGASVILNNTSYAPYSRLALEDGASIQMSNGARNSYDPLAGVGGVQLWMGHVELGPSGRNYVGSPSGYRYYAQLGGKISGGGFYVAPNARLILRSRTDASSDPNTFTNGIVLADNADLTILNGALLPQNGGDVVMTNASFTFKTGLTYSLPPIRCFGDCRFQGCMDNMKDPGTRDKRQYYPKMVFGRHASGAFSTNVVFSALEGLPEVKPYPASTDPSADYPRQAVSTGPEQLMVDKNWMIGLEDVVAGDMLKFDGEIVFSSGVSINVCGQKYARGVKRFKIAEAAKITFKGGKTVTIEDKDWTFSEGDDGKSLYLTCATHGMLLLVR